MLWGLDLKKYKTVIESLASKPVWSCMNLKMGHWSYFIPENGDKIRFMNLHSLDKAE